MHRRATAAGATFVVSIATLVVCARAVHNGTPAVDRQLLTFFVPSRMPVPVRRLFHLADGAVGEYRGLVWQGFLALGLLITMRVRAAFLTSAFLAVSVASTVWLKPFFHRPALIGERVGYFPSTHAAGAFAFCASCVFVCWGSSWRWPVAAAATAVVVVYGATLVYTRSHYPTDVAAGWSVAGAWLWLLLLPGLAASGRLRRTSASSA